MRSQLRFFMHPDDEVRFLSLVGTSASVDLDRGYITCLRGRSGLTDDTGSIQFWRSQLDGDVLTEGRLALATTGFGLEERLPPELVAESEGLYRRLRRQVKKEYVNGLVRWWNPSLPPGPTNPTKPDMAIWVAPAALLWWEATPGHKLKSTLQSAVEVVPLEKRRMTRNWT